MRRIFTALVVLGVATAGVSYAKGISGPPRPLKQPTSSVAAVEAETLVQQLEDAAPRESSLARPL